MIKEAESRVILPYAPANVRPRWWSDLAVGAGVGLVLGATLGITIAMSFTHPFWLIGAGVINGVAAAARSRTLLAAMVASAIVVVIAMATVIAFQFAVGHWPLDEATIEHYGNEFSAAIRLLIGLLLLVCIPSLLAGILTSLVRRFWT